MNKTLPPIANTAGDSISPDLLHAFIEHVRGADEKTELSLPDALADIRLSDRRALAEALVQLGFKNQNDAPLIHTAGFFGDDATAHTIADRLSVLTADDANAHFSIAPSLRALRQIGTRGALMEVQRLALFANFSEVILAARDKLRALADAKAVRVWKIEDDIIPDCGLDSFGGIQFDDGEMKLRFNLSTHLKPFLQNVETHERYDVFPTRDTDASRACEREWAVFEKTIQDAIPVQLHRLEQALALQYRWDAVHFRDVLLSHPLMVHLGQRIIWGTFRATGRIIQSFRLNSERALVDENDEPFVLTDDTVVGIVHAQELSESAASAWGTQLADYEVVTLFPQLDRPIAMLEAERRKDTRIFFESRYVPETFLKAAFQRGWHRKASSWRHEQLVKIYRHHDVIAYFTYEISADEVLVVNSVGFRRHLGFPQHDFQLRDVPGVVYSETMYDIELINAVAPPLTES